MALHGEALCVCVCAAAVGEVFASLSLQMIGMKSTQKHDNRQRRSSEGVSVPVHV